eukprot:10129186-Alexandrium_andersonii.AAC.1
MPRGSSTSRTTPTSRLPAWSEAYVRRWTRAKLKGRKRRRGGGLKGPGARATSPTSPTRRRRRRRRTRPWGPT